jgi:glyoxylase-like metal-dependent hydrolase (beta-lactamase superfamily II)
VVRAYDKGKKLVLSIHRKISLRARFLVELTLILRGEKIAIQLEPVAGETYRLESKIPGIGAVFAVYFIKDGDGAIIEPGPAVLVPAIRQAAEQLGLSRPEYIIPTHIHLDHAGGLGRLAEIFPKTQIVLNRQGAKHMVEPSRLIESTRMAFGDDFEATYGPILPLPESRLKLVRDGDRLKLGSRELLIIHTPGHAAHHIAIFDTKTKGLFCGESLGLIYGPGYPPLPAVAPPSFDLELYLDDMRKLKALKPKLLFYSHGTAADGPEKLIDAAVKNSRLVGDLILRDLKAGRSGEAIIETIGGYLTGHFHAPLDEYELTSNVNGYIHYFRKKGLI